MFKQTMLRFPSVSKLSFKNIKVFSEANRYSNSSFPLFSSNKAGTEEKENYFGFEAVSHEEKARRVQSVFSNVAAKYDLMNDVMSCGIHRLWKDYLIEKLNPWHGMKLLDVAGGTGDIAFRFLEAVSHAQHSSSPPKFKKDLEQTAESGNDSHVVVLDMTENMLSICKEKAKAAGLSKDLTCIQGTAELLPFPDNSFDAYTIAFGIRNVARIDQALIEAQRVLRPGGRFLCLEFSEVQNPVLGWAYDLYSMQVIPCLGQIVAGDWKSYQYLVESIRKFPNQEDFRCRIEDAGFKIVTYENLFNGITTIHSAFKQSNEGT